MASQFEWTAQTPPFSFRYGGRPSDEFLRGWEHQENGAAGDEPREYRRRDPETGLEIVARLRTFDDFAAADWVLELGNRGDADTLIVEDIMPLDLSWVRPAGEEVTFHY